MCLLEVCNGRKNRQQTIDGRQRGVYNLRSLIQRLSWLPTISLKSFRSIELQFVSMTEKIHSFFHHVRLLFNGVY